MPALVELDLVLADRPAVGGRHLGAGEDLLRRGVGHAGSPFVRVDDEAGQGLGVEVGRLLGHDVAVARRRRGSTATGVGSSRNAASAPSRPASTASSASCGGLRVADGARRDRVGVDPGQPLEGDPEQRHVEPADRVAAGRQRAARTRRGGRAGSRRRRRVHRPNRPRAAAGRRRASNRATSVVALDVASTSNRSRGRSQEAARRRRRRDRGAGGASAAPSAARRRLEEQHQDVVERRVLLARAAHPPLVAVAQRRLVAVVAVGDRDRVRAAATREQRRDAASAPSPSAGDRPQPMADAVVVDDVDGRRPGGRVVEDRPPDAARRSSHSATTGLVLTPVARSSL